MHITTIHMDQLTCSVGGSFGEQEHHHVCEFARGGHTLAQGDLICDLLERTFRIGEGVHPFLIERGEAFCYDDGVHPDAIFEQLYRPLTRQRIASAIGSCIGGGAALSGFRGL